MTQSKTQLEATRRRFAKDICKVLIDKHFIRPNDADTIRKTRAVLGRYNTKREMMKSLSAVFSGEQSIASYTRTKPDEHSKKAIKNAAEEKMQILKDLRIIRSKDMPEMKKVLTRCNNTLEIDILTHDLTFGKISYQDWLIKHTA